MTIDHNNHLFARISSITKTEIISINQFLIPLRRMLEYIKNQFYELNKVKISYRDRDLQRQYKDITNVHQKLYLFN